jgi:hypothetical protein
MSNRSSITNVAARPTNISALFCGTSISTISLLYIPVYDDMMEDTISGRCSDMFNDYHPLYPEQQKDQDIRWIRIYEDKPCMICGNFGRDVDWVHYTEASNTMYPMGFQVEDVFKRICKKCLFMKTNEQSWA